MNSAVNPVFKKTVGEWTCTIEWNLAQPKESKAWICQKDKAEQVARLKFEHGFDESLLPNLMLQPLPPLTFRVEPKLGHRPRLYLMLESHLPSVSPVQLPHNQISPGQVLPLIVADIKTSYKKFKYLDRFIEKKLTLLESTYINLALVLEKEQEEKEKRLTVDYLNSEEAIYKPKENIAIQEVFNSRQGHEQPKHLLIEGRAGIGKSTFCKYVAYLWATLPSEKRAEKLGEWANAYELVLLIPLRLLTSSQAKSLGAFLQEYLRSQLPADSIERYLTDHDEKILYLLDGYDEIASNTDHALLTLLLQKNRWILTSRPNYLTGRELEDFLHLEMIGFADEEIEKYIQDFFKEFKQEEKVQPLLDLLKRQPSIHAMAHIPINLELLCGHWKRQEDPIASLTFTELYSNICRDILERCLCERLKDKNALAHTLDYFAIHPPCAHFIKTLETLAWKASESKKIIFTDKLYASIIENSCPPKEELITYYEVLFNELGFLKSTGDLLPVPKRDYYFIHLTF